jgi:acyl-CoA thioester hydrolase
VRMRIPFSDVDMHGRVHNGRYFAYVETAINEHLRQRGLSPFFQPDSTDHVYHVKKIEVVYDRPIRFDDVVDVLAGVARIGTTSLSFTGRVVRVGESEPAVVAEVVWVCVDRASGSAMPIPQATRSALAALLD